MPMKCTKKSVVIHYKLNYKVYLASFLTIIFYLFVVYFCLIGNSSQTIGSKGLKFLGFDGGRPGEVLTKFGEDWFLQ